MRGAGAALAVDDLARDRDYADGVAAGGHGVRIDPVIIVDRGEVTHRLAGVAACDRGDAAAEGGAVAKFVDQARGEVGLCDVAIRCEDRSVGRCQELRDLRLRPRLPDRFAPLTEQRAVQRLAGGARLRALIGAGIGFDERLELADAIDVVIDAQLVDQALVVELVPAGPGEQRSAQRVDPDLAGVGSQAVARVGIAGGIGQDRLLGIAEAADRVGDLVQRRRIAAAEPVKVEHQRLDARVGLRSVDRADDVARAELARRAAARQRGEGGRLFGLFDDRAVEIEDERAVLDRLHPGARVQRSEQQAEEQQHRDQDQPVLDRHQQLPCASNQFHARLLCRHGLARRVLYEQYAFYDKGRGTPRCRGPVPGGKGWKIRRPGRLPQARAARSRGPIRSRCNCRRRRARLNFLRSLQIKTSMILSSGSSMPP